MTGDVRVLVRIWGRDVGMLREAASGRITFEYAPAFRASGLDVSPIHLPAGRQGPVSFPELARKPAFLGLPGVFADALPDQFGNAVIRRYFEERGRPGDAMSPLQRLLYIGDRAMGRWSSIPPPIRIGVRRRRSPSGIWWTRPDESSKATCRLRCRRSCRSAGARAVPDRRR